MLFNGPPEGGHYVRADGRRGTYVVSGFSRTVDGADTLMEFKVDIWLRGDNHATTEVIAPVPREPGAWTDADVVAVLEGMLRALERAKHPEATPDRPVALRGFSWIVSPFEGGGVVIALELTLGAVVAGPFDLAEGDLSARIERVMGTRRANPTVH